MLKKVTRLVHYTKVSILLAQMSCGENVRKFQTWILLAKSKRGVIRGEPAGSLFFFGSRPSREEIGFRPLRWARRDSVPSTPAIF